MNRIYQSLFFLYSICFFSQETISFESSEGFFEGNIHGQKGWLTTNTGAIPYNFPHQVVSTENSSDKLKSLKITKTPVFTSMPSPAGGAIYMMKTGIDVKKFNVSFDVMFTEQATSSSDFCFELLDEITPGISDIMSSICFNNLGEIKVKYFVQNIEHWHVHNTKWVPNKWYRVRMEGHEGGINYYIDNVLLFTRIDIYNNRSIINKIWFVHNNKSGSAYIDNIRINNEESLAVDNIFRNGRLIVFPNPVDDYLSIKSIDGIKNVRVYNLSGRRLKVSFNGDKIDVRNLSAGSYLIIIEMDGINYTEKFIKK